eukprot:TRINITY_DN37600_c0_g1_i1.p1 TRINITY_DN37600_c0_g1~~TRINITY_DN37600_c0_g1_i1.p1  ORF type:complete len:659 (+),score=96.81 TRINITY_DN37600_c0_g1_i1:268-1977(+)
MSDGGLRLASRVAQHSGLPPSEPPERPCLEDILSAAPETRGLENFNGSNHCFLNVAIQALWNLGSFRTCFMAAPEHRHPDFGTAARPDDSVGQQGAKTTDMDKFAVLRSEEAVDLPHTSAEECCFCALRSLFVQYQRSQESALPPDVLRKALCHVWNVRGRFQLGEMGDATETLEALLDFLHACHVEVPLKHATATTEEAGRGAAFSSSSTTAPSVVERTSIGDSVEESRCADCLDDARGEQARSSTSASRNDGRRISIADCVEEASDHACHPRCPSHEVFGIECVDLPRCTFCGATREPTVMSSFLYQVYVAELIQMRKTCLDEALNTAKLHKKNTPLAWSLLAAPPKSDATAKKIELHELLRRLCQHPLDQKCRECSSLHTTVSERWITRPPLVFVLSLVWSSGSPLRDDVWQLLLTVQPELRMEHVFRTERFRPTGCHFAPAGERKVAGDAEGLGAEQGPDDLDCAEEAYVFRGLVCFCGMHYIALFWSWSRTKWILFDDHCVKEEADWCCVANMIAAGQYVPTLLFYESPSGSHVPNLEASKQELIRQMHELTDESRTVPVCTVS